MGGDALWLGVNAGMAHVWWQEKLCQCLPQTQAHAHTNTHRQTYNGSSINNEKIADLASSVHSMGVLLRPVRKWQHFSPRGQYSVAQWRWTCDQ